MGPVMVRISYIQATSRAANSRTAPYLLLRGGTYAEQGLWDDSLCMCHGSMHSRTDCTTQGIAAARPDSTFSAAVEEVEDPRVGEFEDPRVEEVEDPPAVEEVQNPVGQERPLSYSEQLALRKAERDELKRKDKEKV